MSDFEEFSMSGDSAIIAVSNPDSGDRPQAGKQAETQTGTAKRDRFEEIFGGKEPYKGGFGGFGGFGTPSPHHDTHPNPEMPDTECVDDGAVPAFPLDALPPVMRRIVEGTAAETLLPQSLAAVAALATLSASTGAGLQVRIGNRVTPANLYVLIGMRSGTGKDEIDRHIVAPLIDCDTRLRQWWKEKVEPGLLEALDEAKSRLAYQRQVRNRARSEDVRAEAAEMIREAQGEIASIQDQLNRCPKLAMTSPGKVQLGLDMMNQDGEAIAIVTPEGRDSVFRAGDEGFYCAAYSGTRVSDCRRTRQNMELTHPCLTLMLMGQPDFINRQLELEKMVESGLMPRFLLFICNPELKPVSMDQSVLPEEDAAAWLELVFRSLDTFRLRQLEPMIIEADRGVNQLFTDYENENRRRRNAGGDMADIQSFAARWTEQAIRIGVVLHVGLHGRDAGNHELSAATATAAIRIGRWFADRQVEALLGHRDAWLRRRGEKLREKLLIMQKGWANLGELAKAGWTNEEVRQIADRCPDLIAVERKPADRRGGRPTHRVKPA